MESSPKSKKASDTPKPFECRFCPMRFSKYQVLAGHMKRHRRERKYEKMLHAQQLILQQDHKKIVPARKLLQRRILFDSSDLEPARTQTLADNSGQQSSTLFSSDLQPAPAQALANNSGKQASLTQMPGSLNAFLEARSILLAKNHQVPLERSNFNSVFTYGYQRTAPIQAYANNTEEQATMSGSSALDSDISSRSAVLNPSENQSYAQPATLGSRNIYNTTLMPPYNMVQTTDMSNLIGSSSSGQQAFGIRYERNPAPPVFSPNLDAGSSVLDSLGALMQRINHQFPLQKSNSNRLFASGYLTPVQIHAPANNTGQQYASSANNTGQQSTLLFSSDLQPGPTQTFADNSCQQASMLFSSDLQPAPTQALANNSGAQSSITQIRESSNAFLEAQSILMAKNHEVPLQRSNSNKVFTSGYQTTAPIQAYANNTEEQATMYGSSALASDISSRSAVLNPSENQSYAQPATFGSVNIYNMVQNTDTSNLIDSSSGQQGFGIQYERNPAPPVFPPNLNAGSSDMQSFGALMQRVNHQFQLQRSNSNRLFASGYETPVQIHAHGNKSGQQYASSANNTGQQSTLLFSSDLQPASTQTFADNSFQQASMLFSSDSQHPPTRVLPNNSGQQVSIRQIPGSVNAFLEAESILMAKKHQVPLQRSNSNRVLTSGYRTTVPIQAYANNTAEQATMYESSALASNISSRSVVLDPSENKAMHNEEYLDH